MTLLAFSDFLFSLTLGIFPNKTSSSHLGICLWRNWASTVSISQFFWEFLWRGIRLGSLVRKERGHSFHSQAPLREKGSLENTMTLCTVVGRMHSDFRGWSTTSNGKEEQEPARRLTSLRPQWAVLARAPLSTSRTCPGRPRAEADRFCCLAKQGSRGIF